MWNKVPTSWFFLASFRSTNLDSMMHGYSFMPGGVFEHILARLRASYCARIPFFRGWVRIVSSFSGTSPGSTVCFCSFLAWRRARNDSLDFCALQHIKCSRSAVSEWRHCRSLSLNQSSKFSLDTILTLTLCIEWKFKVKIFFDMGYVMLWGPCMSFMHYIIHY